MSDSRYLEATRQMLGLWEFQGRQKADEIIALQMYGSEHPGEPMITEVVMPRIRGEMMAKAKNHNQGVRECLLKSQPIYWGADMAALVHRSAISFPIDRALRPEDIPVEHGYVWFDDLLELPALWDTPIYTKAPKADWLRGFFWAPYDTGEEVRIGLPDRPDTMARMRDKGVYVGFIVHDPDTREGGIIQGMLPWTYGTTIEQMVNGSVNAGKLASKDRTTAKLQHVISALLLMQQPIIHHSKERVSGDVRKLWKRTDTEAQDVDVVYLRRYQYDRKDEAESRPVDWQTRWWVSPHWRTLRRGTVDEKTTFIYPYVKGPAGLPLKDPSEKVLAVIR